MKLIVFLIVMAALSFSTWFISTITEAFSIVNILSFFLTELAIVETFYFIYQELEKPKTKG